MVLSSAQETHHDLVRKDKFKVPVNRTDVERDWKGRGFSCDLFTDPPGREWNDFVHKDDELVAVVQGTMRFDIGEEEMVLKPGDEVFIPAGTKHSTKNVGNGVAEWLYGYG